MKNYSKEIFRKTLHMMCIAFLISWAYVYDDWKKSALYFLIAGVIASPVLFLLSRVSEMTKIFNARKQGEYAISCLALALMYALVTTVCWGLLGERLLAIACIAAWGPGDAAAALIGMRFGKHKIGRKKKKSLEGTIAMFAFSFLSVLITLFIYGKFSVPELIIVSLITAAVTAITELNVLSGLDTFFCPVSAMIVIVAADLVTNLMIHS